MSREKQRDSIKSSVKKQALSNMRKIHPESLLPRKRITLKPTILFHSWKTV